MKMTVVRIVMLMEMARTQRAADVGVDRPVIMRMSDKHIQADPRQQKQRDQQPANRHPASVVPGTDCFLQLSHGWLNDDRWLGWLSNAHGR